MRQEVAEKDQDGSDEQGHLSARANGDVDGQFHLIFECHEDCRAVLGGVPDDRHKDDPDKHFSHAKDLGCGLDSPHKQLAHHRDTDRRAHFVSALCVAWPDGHTEEFEARIDGTLVCPPRGDHGFGYDPMFQPDGFALTFGEMTSEEKHGLPPKGRALSHRARAFLKLAEACLDRR